MAVAPYPSKDYQESSISSSAPPQLCCGISRFFPAMPSLRSVFGGGNQDSAKSKSVSVDGTPNSDHNKNAKESMQKTTNEKAASTGKETISRSREVTPRLDGWSEADAMSWEPNNYEKDLVKRTWSDDFEFLYDLGAAIYTYIFDHNPHTRELFPAIHRHGDQWRQSNEFRSQALKFVQTIAYAAKNLYHMEECLVPRLIAIGERHVKYASRGFRPEHWNIFLDAMEQALTEHIRSLNDFSEEQRADATRVWRRLSHFIIAFMKKGYLTQEAQERGRKN